MGVFSQILLMISLFCCGKKLVLPVSSSCMMSSCSRSEPLLEDDLLLRDSGELLLEKEEASER